MRACAAAIKERFPDSAFHTGSPLGYDFSVDLLLQVVKLDYHQLLGLPEGLLTTTNLDEIVNRDQVLMRCILNGKVNGITIRVIRAITGLTLRASKQFAEGTPSLIPAVAWRKISRNLTETFDCNVTVSDDGGF